MALSIKDEELDRDVRRLARATGQNLTGAIRLAVRNELARRERSDAHDPTEIKRRVWATLAEIDRLPVLDARSADELIGYGKDGLPS